MRGDVYKVFQSVRGHTTLVGTAESPMQAIALRRHAFAEPGPRSVWIMRENPSLNVRQQIFGHTEQRRR